MTVTVFQTAVLVLLAYIAAGVTSIYHKLEDSHS